MAGNVGRGPSGVCIIVITNFRRVAVAPIYNPTAFKILAIMVDKDRIQGSAEQARGKVKEVVGKVTGDSKLEGEGKADQCLGAPNRRFAMPQADWHLSLGVGHNEHLLHHRCGGRDHSRRRFFGPASIRKSKASQLGKERPAIAFLLT
jgi:uncharacterized protein YjbJ (UPF0337 family)